jgi:hypothetical protein
MDIVTSFDPSAKTTDTFATNLSNGIGKIIIWNESNWILDITFADGSMDLAPAWTATIFELEGPAGKLTWKQDTQLTGNTPPISKVWVVAYRDNETIPGVFPLALVRQVNIGSTVTTTGSSTTSPFIFNVNNYSSPQAAANALVAAGVNAGGLYFPAGYTFQLTTPILFSNFQGNVRIFGDGLSSVIEPDPSFVGQALIYIQGGGKGTIDNLLLRGISTTYSSNPACDGICLDTTSNSIDDWTIENVQIDYMNGWAVNFLHTNSNGYMTLVDVISHQCKQGLHSQNGGLTMANVVMDNVAAGDSYYFENCSDNTMVGCQGYSPNSGNSLHLKGAKFFYASSVDLGGGTPNAPCVLIEDGTATTENVSLHNVLIQKGTVGLEISGATNVRIVDCDIFFNQTHGIQIDNVNTIHNVLISNCDFFQNNTSAAGSTYDLENLSTFGEIQIDACQFVNNGATVLTACVDTTSTGSIQNCEFLQSGAYPNFSANGPGADLTIYSKLISTILKSVGGGHTLQDWNMGFNTASVAGDVHAHGIKNKLGVATAPTAMFATINNTSGFTCGIGNTDATNFTLFGSANINCWWLAILI